MLKHIQVPLEIRAENNAEMTRGTIEGYASVFGVIDSYDTVFERGCFGKSLKERMPAFLLHHNSESPAGVTLECREDGKGLYYKAEMNLEVQAVREAYALAKQGALKGFSVGFVPKSWEDNSETDIRSFKEVDLMEVSMVTFPANKDALVAAVRNELPKTIKEFERFLRDAGFSKNEALRIASHGFKTAQDLRDAENERLTKSLENLINTIKGN